MDVSASLMIACITVGEQIIAEQLIEKRKSYDDI